MCIVEDAGSLCALLDWKGAHVGPSRTKLASGLRTLDSILRNTKTSDPL